MYAPVRTAAPAATPVSVAEAKAHLRVESSDEDTLIAGLVSAATSHLDGWSGALGRAIVTQTWRQDFDGFPATRSRCMRLPLWPVASVTSVTYRDANGTTQTVSAADYSLLSDERGAFIRFVEDFDSPIVYDDGPAVSVTYVAGLAAADVPAAIKQAILLLVGHWFANREAVVTGTIAVALPMTVDALLAPLRRIGV